MTYQKVPMAALAACVNLKAGSSDLTGLIKEKGWTAEGDLVIVPADPTEAWISPAASGAVETIHLKQLTNVLPTLNAH